MKGIFRTLTEAELKIRERHASFNEFLTIFLVFKV